VADGVSKDPETCLPFTGDTSGTKDEWFLLGLVGVMNANVEMQLLGYARSGQRGGTHSVTRWKASSRRPGCEPMTTQPSMSSLTLIPST
jgi:hypothetical protein